MALCIRNPEGPFETHHRKIGVHWPAIRRTRVREFLVGSEA